MYRARPKDGSAWVTGASSGLGRAVALELARRGYEVHATARRTAELDTLAAESVGLPGSILPAPGDVVDREGLAALVAGIEARGPVALAVLNAGLSARDGFETSAARDFNRRSRLTYKVSPTAFIRSCPPCEIGGGVSLRSWVR